MEDPIEQTALIEKPEAPMSTEVQYDSFFSAGDIPADKMIIPRLSLLQALSDAVQEDGQKQGTYQNTVTNENYGETLLLIPIVKPAYGALYIEQGEGLKCKSTDGITNMHGDKCEQCPFNAHYNTWVDNRPPKCSATIDLLCLEATTLTPMVLTFRSVSYKAGQRFITALAMSAKAQAYRIGARREKNDRGTFYTVDPKGSQPLTEEQYKAAMQWRERFKVTKFEAADE